jgi:photosystem II stability/assembly factor-like uncharacterized protein
MSRRDTAGRVRPRFAAPYKSMSILAALGVALLLSACDGGSGMSGVKAEAAKQVRRSDRFQAVAGNGTVMVAVGAYGVVETSADQGASWRRSQLPGGPALIDVAACGDGSFAALDIGGAVWRANAEAGNWEAFALPPVDAALDLTCAPDGRLWVVGARGAILVSADGGKSWDDRSTGEDLQLLGVQFLSAHFGVIAGEFGTVMTSQDGGATWTAQPTIPNEFYPQGMHFLKDGRGWLVGLGGTLLATTDAGATWTRHQAPIEAPLYGVWSDGGLVHAVGAVGTAFTFDPKAGGWTRLANVGLADLRGIAPSGAGLVLAGTGALALAPANPPVSAAKN